MSGGHWNYAGQRMLDVIMTITDDPEARRRWPQTAALLKEIAPVLKDIEHEMDWDLSGDSPVANDERFDLKCMAEILHAVLVKMPDAWFPRGKWATIQAVQDRHERWSDDRQQR